MGCTTGKGRFVEIVFDMKEFYLVALNFFPGVNIQISYRLLLL